MRSQSLPALAFVIGMILLAGCQPDPNVAPTDTAPPWVVTAPIEGATGRTWSLTGAVHARHEIPLSFRLAGEIQGRQVNAGERVAAGQVLFRLDPRDVEQQRLAAQASLASAQSEFENAARERARLADLLPKRLASQQDYDRATTATRAAEQRLAAARATLEQARNALAYTTLTAPAAGVLLEAVGQVGQVVAPGQAVAVLATDGPREAEVFVPEDRRQDLPLTASAHLLGHNEPVQAEQRELAGAADPVTRTWRARYRLAETSPAPELGTTVTLRFDRTADDDGGAPARVPLGAILERGAGPVVWRLTADGRVAPEPIELLRLTDEYAEIRTHLPLGTEVVALGVNRLEAGQLVRVRQR